MNTEKYNGWTNYETWLCNLWYDNYWTDTAQEIYDRKDEETEDSEMIQELAGIIQEDIESNGEIPENGFLADIINAAFREIDYYEIAEHYIDDVDKSD